MFVGLEVVYTVFVGSGDFDAIRYHDTLYTSFVGGDKAVDCGAFGRLDNAFYNGNGKLSERYAAVVSFYVCPV